MLLPKHIRNQNIPHYFDDVSEKIYGQSFTRFIKDAEETGDINPMNEAYLAINDVILSLQNPDHLKIKIDHHKLFKDVDIFYKGKFLYGTRESVSEYLYQTYLKIIDKYIKPDIRDITRVCKMYRRINTINEILNE